MKVLYALSATFFFAACVSSKIPTSVLEYLGTLYAPTDSVRVYVDSRAIEQPYTVIGKGYLRPFMLEATSVHYIQANAITMGKNNGADAVLIEDGFLPIVGNRSVVHTDSLGRIDYTVENRSLQHSGNNRFLISFIKYK